MSSAAQISKLEGLLERIQSRKAEGHPASLSAVVSNDSVSNDSVSNDSVSNDSNEVEESTPQSVASQSLAPARVSVIPQSAASAEPMELDDIEEYEELEELDPSEVSMVSPPSVAQASIPPVQDQKTVPPVAAASSSIAVEEYDDSEFGEADIPQEASMPPPIGTELDYDAGTGEVELEVAVPPSEPSPQSFNSSEEYDIGRESFPPAAPISLSPRIPATNQIRRDEISDNEVMQVDGEVAEMPEYFEAWLSQSLALKPR